MLTEGNRLALEFATQTAEVANDIDCCLCLGARLGAERVAGLECNSTCKLLDACFKGVRNSGEKPPPLSGDGTRPGWERRGCRFRRARNSLGAASWNLGDRAAV